MSNITYDPTLRDFLLQDRRIVATGRTGPDLPSLQRPINPAFDFDEDDTAVLGILTGPTRQEMDEARNRLANKVNKDGFFISYEDATDYLESNHWDVETAYNEFRLCNPDSRDEALSDFQRNI